MSKPQRIYRWEHFRHFIHYLSARLLCGCRVDQSPHCRYSIRRKAHSLCVFLNRRLVRRQIHTVDFVARYVALQPLNFCPHSLKYRHGLSRDFLKFSVRQVPRSRYFSLDHELWHRLAPRPRMLTSLSTRFKAGYYRLTNASLFGTT